MGGWAEESRGTTSREVSLFQRQKSTRLALPRPLACTRTMWSAYAVIRRHKKGPATGMLGWQRRTEHFRSEQNIFLSGHNRQKERKRGGGTFCQSKGSLARPNDATTAQQASITTKTSLFISLLLSFGPMYSQVCLTARLSPRIHIIDMTSPPPLPALLAQSTFLLPSGLTLACPRAPIAKPVITNES